MLYSTLNTKISNFSSKSKQQSLNNSYVKIFDRIMNIIVVIWKNLNWRVCWESSYYSSNYVLMEAKWFFCGLKAVVTSQYLYYAYMNFEMSTIDSYVYSKTWTLFRAPVNLRVTNSQLQPKNTRKNNISLNLEKFTNASYVRGLLSTGKNNGCLRKMFSK